MQLAEALKSFSILEIEEDGLAREHFGLHEDGVCFTADSARRMDGLISAKTYGPAIRRA
ncbi:hypothetical protein IVB18_04995 [Bradyrhizobium sp. 186]|uniref:hypothetical protein n=1 Tax=Bradyrhizobium sp. 186 TaxID=2782654 RepID=UPI00200129F4|nr:hypothetical protein [Bradyrhizobium sp. 186]UPK36713.1 hypothetical protein IVB18_04995 [Bradyrhizobium sp. 186]